MLSLAIEILMLDGKQRTRDGQWGLCPPKSSHTKKATCGRGRASEQAGMADLSVPSPSLQAPIAQW